MPFCSLRRRAFFDQREWQAEDHGKHITNGKIILIIKQKTKKGKKDENNLS